MHAVYACGREAVEPLADGGRAGAGRALVPQAPAAVAITTLAASAESVWRRLERGARDAGATFRVEMTGVRKVVPSRWVDSVCTERFYGAVGHVHFTEPVNWL
jgi:hypothetical protein